MAFDDLDDLYRDVILDHRRNPRNSDRLSDADIVADGVNPFCGDEIHLQMALGADGRVERIGLQGLGCSINQAAGSILTESVAGKTLSEIESVSAVLNDMMHGDMPPDELLDSLGAIRSLSGVRRYPVRIKCALLAWTTLEDGIEYYRRDRAPIGPPSSV